MKITLAAALMATDLKLLPSNLILCIHIKLESQQLISLVLMRVLVVCSKVIVLL